MQCLAKAWEAFCSEGEEREKAIESVVDGLKILNTELKQKFFGGQRLGYMDIMLGWIAHWLPVMEVAGGMKIMDSDKFPAIEAWKMNFLQVPIIRDNLPDHDKMIDSFRIIRQSMKASKN